MSTFRVRGMGDWKAPYEPAGAVQNKVADAAMASKMTFLAAAGHACGLSFKAQAHLDKYPQFAWQSPLLGDMNAHKWTRIHPRPDRRTMKVAPSGVDGVHIHGPEAAEFEAALIDILGRAPKRVAAARTAVFSDRGKFLMPDHRAAWGCGSI